MHGLFVATFLVQHPHSRFAGAERMDALRVIALKECARTGRHDRATFERALALAQAQPDGVPAAPVTPVRAARTIADLDPDAPPGHAARVVAWARAVAEAAP